MFIQKRSCLNCIKGTQVPINKDILCREKGIVSPDYVCTGHRFSPITKPSTSSKKCIDCSYFILSENQGSLGTCKLFSTRKADGTIKNACSKFEYNPHQKDSDLILEAK